MGIRQTSINCYNQIKKEGLLSKRRMEVYKAIMKNAPCTSAEAMAGILNSKNVLSQSRARFTELRQLGVIYERGERECSITGRKVIEWDLTDKIPNKKKLPPSPKKVRVVRALEAFNNLLKRKQVASKEEWNEVARLIQSI